MLSIKGREPFIRMQLWLTDPNNVDRLQQMKSERREANKRRRTNTGTNGPTDNSSDTSSNDTADFYHTNTDGSPGPPSAKKQRVLFSEEQKEALRLAFALDPYPNMATIEFLASELNLAARTITNWFHNHRMRLKQTIPHNNNDASPPSAALASQNSGSSFDPGHFRLLLTQRLTEIHKEGGGGAMPPFPFFNPSVAAMVSPAAAANMPPQHLLMAAAMREQFSGLDLSMTSLKKDMDDDDSGDDSDDSNLSHDFHKARQPAAPAAAPAARSSRRKPAAPQWVNPEWQADEKDKDETKDSPPAIINGVCVMQGDNFDSLRRRSCEVDDETATVRVEPTDKEVSGAHDKYEESNAAETTKLELNVTSAEQTAAASDDEDDWEQKIDQDKRSTHVESAGADDWEF